MTRVRQTTERTLARRAAAAAARAAIRAAWNADPDNPRNIRRRLARQIVQAVLGLPELPPENHTEVRTLVGAHRRFPTDELYAMRDRSVRARAAQDRLNAKYGAPGPS